MGARRRAKSSLVPPPNKGGQRPPPDYHVLLAALRPRLGNPGDRLLPCSSDNWRTGPAAHRWEVADRSFDPPDEWLDRCKRHEEDRRIQRAVSGLPLLAGRGDRGARMGCHEPADQPSEWEALQIAHGRGAGGNRAGRCFVPRLLGDRQQLAASASKRRSWSRPDLRHGLSQWRWPGCPWCSGPGL